MKNIRKYFNDKSDSELTAILTSYILDGLNCKVCPIKDINCKFNRSCVTTIGDWANKEIDEWELLKNRIKRT